MWTVEDYHKAMDSWYHQLRYGNHYEEYRKTYLEGGVETILPTLPSEYVERMH